MKPSSVLGKYAPVVAAIVVLFSIAAAALARILGHPDGFLDGLALASFGLVAGTAGTLTYLNGTVKRTAEQDDELSQLRAMVAAIAADRTPTAGA